MVKKMSRMLYKYPETTRNFKENFKYRYIKRGRGLIDSDWSKENKSENGSREN